MRPEGYGAPGGGGGELSAQCARPRPMPAPPLPPARVALLMGVAGAGKTTVGQALAARLGWDFQDADASHSADALARMATGQPLTEADRAPWLERLAALVAARLAGGPPTVLACSALRAAYRARLHAGDPRVRVLWLDAPAAVLAARLAARAGHVAGPALLPSQLATLEPPAGAVRLDATQAVDALAEAAAAAVQSR